ncbi:MAG TPA: ATP-binding protein [Actinomycetales bacterium]|jgi:hypothetical protein
MGVVRLQFRAAATHVRTARLVAVTVARRAGLDEDSVEGVRQAVGEACAIAVRHLGPTDQITLTLDDAPTAVPPAGAPRLVASVRPAAADVGTDDRMLFAVLTGMTDTLDLEQDGDGSVLRLAWMG